MTRKEWLAWQIVSNDFKKGVELGVLRGPTFKYLIENCKKLELTGVDVFCADKRWRAQGVNTTEELQKVRAAEWYFELLNFCDEHQPRANIMRDFTNQAHKNFEDESLDFIFVDAAHTYDAVVEDIKLWEPKVRKGGLVSGHDIDMLAVRMAVSQHNQEYNQAPDNIWYWTKK
jgi:hypothetical protein